MWILQQWRDPDCKRAIDALNIFVLKVNGWLFSCVGRSSTPLHPTLPYFVLTSQTPYFIIVISASQSLTFVPLNAYRNRSVAQCLDFNYLSLSLSLVCLVSIFVSTALFRLFFLFPWSTPVISSRVSYLCSLCRSCLLQCAPSITDNIRVTYNC